MKVKAQIASTNKFKMHEEDVFFPLSSLDKMKNQAPGLTVYIDYDKSKPIGKVLSSKLKNNKLFIIIDIDIRHLEVEKEYYALAALNVDGYKYDFSAGKIELTHIGLTTELPLDKSLRSLMPVFKPLEHIEF